MFKIETYKNKCRVLVVKLTSPKQLLESGKHSIHQIIQEQSLSSAIGVYFYRFKNLDNPQAFSKIGEVSRSDGVAVRQSRGWLTPPSYGDSYKKLNNNGEKKVIYTDVEMISEENPMYFVFYELEVENAFPKIDEISNFAKHIEHFGRSTRNKENANTFSRLGSNLVWHKSAFNEVLNCKLPSQGPYP
ncbi:hypothetical protein L4D11_05615 [Vibrio gigantis]|uniref:hypothetical protein n=1 Tax=Vibrio gigantis TaxID=296199 RepID=UPI003D0A7A9B